MNTRPTIRLTVPQDKNMSRWQRLLAKEVKKRLKSENLRVELDGYDFDRLEERFERTRQCQGVLVLAFAQWEAQRLYRDRGKSITVPSEFAHIANAMAMATRKPLLVLRERTVAARGSLKEGYVHPVVLVPHKATREWTETSAFQDAILEWLKKVREHKHAFLGYSSRAHATAEKVRRFLEDTLELSVLDWQEFPPGRMIMENIAEAERRTDLGVFLFTKDDEIETGKSRQEVPRDNVVFEAGFFSGAKGGWRTLIIVESGAKVPTDLGGVTYVEFRRHSSISSSEEDIRRFFRSHLSG